MTTENIAQHLSDQITRQLNDLPDQVYDAILNEVSGDTPVGAALRENGGETLKQTLRGMSPDTLPLMAERLVNLDNVLDYQSMRHTPDLKSLLSVADAAGGLALQGDGEIEDAEKRWSDTLRSVVSTIPGRDHEGNVVSRYQLYAQEAQDDPYDVVSAAKEALTDPNLDPADREYWQQQIRSNVPELAGVRDILPEMVPDNPAPQERADAFNEGLGRAAGAMMKTLTGHSHPQKADPEASGESPQTTTMDTFEVAEPVDATTPAFVDEVLPDGTVRGES